MFSTMYVKKILEENKIEEAKQYINRFFFKGDKGIFFFNGRDNIFEYIDKKDLDVKVSKDLIYIDYKQKGHPITFEALDYLKSAGIMDNIYVPTINYEEKMKEHLSKA